MSPFFGDVVARARGLRSRLLRPEELARLAHVPGCGALARELAARGVPMEPGGRDPAVIQVGQGLRRHAARRLMLLARWLGPRVRFFAVLFEDETRRALRLLLRGVGQGEPSEARLAGAPATPDLPERLLHALAAAETLDAFVGTLARAGSHYAPALEAARRRAPGSLLALEIALQRTFAARAESGVRGGGGELADFAAETIDLENAWSALLQDSASLPGGVDLFVPGGRRLDRAQHEAVMREPDPGRRRARLARIFGPTPLSGVFEGDAPVATFEARALRVRLAEQRRRARLDPLGAAPVLEYVLALRVELHDLGRIAWGLEAEMPAAWITRELLAVA